MLLGVIVPGTAGSFSNQAQLNQAIVLDETSNDNVDLGDTSLLDLNPETEINDELSLSPSASSDGKVSADLSNLNTGVNSISVTNRFVSTDNDLDNCDDTLNFFVDFEMDFDNPIYVKVEGEVYRTVGEFNPILVTTFAQDFFGIKQSDRSIVYKMAAPEAGDYSIIANVFLNESSIIPITTGDIILCARQFTSSDNNGIITTDNFFQPENWNKYRLNDTLRFFRSILYDFTEVTELKTVYSIYSYYDYSYVNYNFITDFTEMTTVTGRGIWNNYKYLIPSILGGSIPRKINII